MTGNSRPLGRHIPISRAAIAIAAAPRSPAPHPDLPSSRPARRSFARKMWRLI